MAQGREEQVKILVIGPPKVGKSVVSDFISGTREKPPLEYRETNGLRILECFLDGLNIGGGRRIGRGTRAVVELWDVSGATRFQNCWPAIKQDAHGILFVFNPEIAGQERELEFWYKSFGVDPDIPMAHCLIFAHHSSAGEATIPRFAPPLSTAKVMHTSVDFYSEDFKNEFERLVEKILVTRREKEEQDTMKNDVMSGAVAIGQSQ